MILPEPIRASSLSLLTPPCFDPGSTIVPSADAARTVSGYYARHVDGTDSTFYINFLSCLMLTCCLSSRSSWFQRVSAKGFKVIMQSFVSFRHDIEEALLRTSAKFSVFYNASSLWKISFVLVRASSLQETGLVFLEVFWVFFLQSYVWLLKITRVFCPVLKLLADTTRLQKLASNFFVFLITFSEASMLL